MEEGWVWGRMHQSRGQLLQRALRWTAVGARGAFARSLVRSPSLPLAVWIPMMYLYLYNFCYISNPAWYNFMYGQRDRRAARLRKP